MIDLTKLLKKINDTPEHKHRYHSVCNYIEHENVYNLVIYDTELPFDDCQDREDYAHVGVTISPKGEVLDYSAFSVDKDDEIKVWEDLFGTRMTTSDADEKYSGKIYLKQERDLSDA